MARGWRPGDDLEPIPPGPSGTALLAFAAGQGATSAAYRASIAELARAWDHLDHYLGVTENISLDERREGE